MRNSLLTRFISFALMAVTLIPTNAASTTTKATAIWLRPIKETIVINIKDRNYDFLAGEIVAVQGEGNGNIIINGDTLPTDDLYLTNSKLAWSVDSTYINSFPNFAQCFTAVDSTKVEIDLSKIERKGNLRIYNPQNRACLSIPYGSVHTIDLPTLGLMPYEPELRYIPDSIYGGVAEVDYASIQQEQAGKGSLEQERDNSKIMLLCAIFLVLMLAGGIFVVYRKLKKRGGANIPVLKPISKLQKIVNSISDEINQSETQGDNDISNAVNNVIDTAAKLTDQLHELAADGGVDNIDFSESIDKVENCINSINQKRKDYKKIKRPDKEDDNNYLTELTKLYVSSESILSDLSEQISNMKTAQPALGDEQDGVGAFHIDVSDNSVADLSTQVSRLKIDLASKKIECNQLIQKKEFLSKELKTVGEKVENLQKELNKEKATRDEAIKAKVAEAKDKCEKKVENARKEAEKEIRSANERADKAENKANTIANELNQKFEKERTGFIKEKDNLSKELANTKGKLAEKTNNLNLEICAHNVTKREVERLSAETKAFNDRLSGVTDSQPYCRNIYDLVKLSEGVQGVASDILQSNLSDPYFAYKALALFSAKLNPINLPSFYTDVEMVSKTGFVIKGTPLAAYDKRLSAQELVDLTKNYFFTTYLKTYVDALMVLIESLAGLKYLIGDVKPSHIKSVEKYRDQITTIVQKLGIQVLTVKIFDSVGVNTDLLATEIDAGYDKHGAILEIENCKVSLIGGKPDDQRIVVKIQK